MTQTRKRAAALAFAVVAVLLLLFFWPGKSVSQATAYFPRAVGLFEGSDVRILGVRIGEVKNVDPQGKRVKVDFQYDADMKIPADAKAAIVTPSIVSDRYLQLFPVYEKGPTLEDNAVIPEARTAVPVELDRVFEALNDLSIALGPEGANKDGSVTRLVDVLSSNLEGQGQNVNDAIRDFSEAIATFGDGRGDLFGTLRNLDTFIGALAESDGQVREFTQRLAAVSTQLADERGQLTAALQNLAVALNEVSGFVRDNKTGVAQNLTALTDVTKILVNQQKNLEESLDHAPTGLSGFLHAYNEKARTVDVRGYFPQLDSQADLSQYLCSVLRAFAEVNCGSLAVFDQLQPGSLQGGAEDPLTQLLRGLS